MNRSQQLEQLKQDLLHRREALSRALTGDLTMLQEIRRTGGDVVDFASESTAEVLSAQLAEAESRELANIELALLKIKKNCYGQCEECGNNIALPRLEALPYAPYCIECQRMMEDMDMEDAHSDAPVAFPTLSPTNLDSRSTDFA
ncbi:MAG: TraR/DksA family transcriptional regulator [Planctomycetaceae bacterium]|nr:TraR/DksA family transcriptional regulator [Planctomycetaceae bacterium]